MTSMNCMVNGLLSKLAQALDTKPNSSDPHRSCKSSNPLDFQIRLHYVLQFFLITQLSEEHIILKYLDLHKHIFCIGLRGKTPKILFACLFVVVFYPFQKESDYYVKLLNNWWWFPVTGRYLEKSSLECLYSISTPQLLKRKIHQNVRWETPTFHGCHSPA